LKTPLRKYYSALLERFGPQRWWPAETPFEVMVGAILAQNTAWKNVERAIASLKAYDLLDPRRLDATDAGTLALAIRPAGTFNVKARRLKAYVEWFLRRFDGVPARMGRVPLARLREELLEIKGIGPETADSILLYAVGLPSFVVDAYTYRVLRRHELIPEGAGYDEMKDLFESALRPDVPTYNEFHALLVAVGKEYCRAKARCDACPLRPFLP
jgi:endonuclease-3 related protein